MNNVILAISENIFTKITNVNLIFFTEYGSMYFNFSRNTFLDIFDSRIIYTIIESYALSVFLSLNKIYNEKLTTAALNGNYINNVSLKKLDIFLSVFLSVLYDPTDNFNLNFSKNIMTNS